MSKVIVKQIRSQIDKPQRQKDTLKALGLGKINAQVELELSPSVQGMINRISHLVTVIEA